MLRAARVCRVLLPLACAAIFAQDSRRLAPPNGSNYWTVNGRYAGSKQCAQCHPAQARDFRLNSMSRALEPIDQWEVLHRDSQLTWSGDKYRFSILRANGKVVYRVTDGIDSFETPLLYAFGQGKAGQTYIYKADGNFYESRVSYYADSHALDRTVGLGSAQPPPNAREAAGRRMDVQDARACFGCHTTGARLGSTLQLDDFEGGVQCESCHGPGGAHIDSIRSGKSAAGSIRPLKGMDAQEANEMCGACHRTWDQVKQMGVKGVNNVRFMPYRLSNSRCFSPADARIACTACHNPHGGLVSDAKQYDAKCAACHDAIKAKCPVGRQGCVTCHMPLVNPPETHHAFPDHWIRVVRGKSDYPG